ncbi:MAG TPA: hypothetical protein VF469_32250 [Kofleriaceae bacterium]
MTVIGFVGEDENHFRIATTLIWARAFLDEVDRHVLPAFGHRQDA